MWQNSFGTSSQFCVWARNGTIFVTTRQSAVGWRSQISVGVTCVDGMVTSWHSSVPKRSNVGFRNKVWGTHLHYWNTGRDQLWPGIISQWSGPHIFFGTFSHQVWGLAWLCPPSSLTKVVLQKVSYHVLQTILGSSSLFLSFVEKQSLKLHLGTANEGYSYTTPLSGQSKSYGVSICVMTRIFQGNITQKIGSWRRLIHH